MMHILIRIISRLRTSDKKYLEKLRIFFTDEVFKDAIFVDVASTSTKESIEPNNRALKMMSFV